MPDSLPFKIYDASAGSGKTYTLVKEYLKILLASKKQTTFKTILAVTFTNKAVAEMKERIIKTLKAFSDEAILDMQHTMFVSISEELKIPPRALHEKAAKLLEIIVHNYASFDISTIDGFTHKLIRTFAYDLKLPLNFEVELDQEALIGEAVDNLIAKAGTDKRLTGILVDFAIEKADDDKSWDVSFDFNKIAKLLTNENDIPYINTLKDKTLDDFKALKTLLKKELKTTETLIIDHAESALKLIAAHGLEFSDFTRGTLPNHFKKASELNLDGLYNNQLETNLSEQSSIYNKTLSADKKQVIDSILPQIEAFFIQAKKLVFHLKFLINFYKNITPLSVLNAINKELNVLKEQQNKMLISEFNTIISEQIKDQPAPFIYERIGEKFKHYFIDEFQDTSILQWRNLIPLLDNSLSADGGSAMLVGDAKQAIYRWRGGKAEQFIGLINEDEPFHIKKNKKSLPDNFRSQTEIVDFNNNFFSYVGNLIFTEQDYKALYSNAHQNAKNKLKGYINITFLDFEKDDNRDEMFTAKVLETIYKCIDNGFDYGSMCVLVRKKKEGVAVANFLSKKGIPILSSDTLLISNSPDIVFLNNILKLLLQPKNNDAKIIILNYLAAMFDIENKHAFYKDRVPLSLSEFFKSFESLGIYVNPSLLLQNSLYDIIESLLRHFNLVATSNAYIQFYLDIVLDYLNKKGSDISGFLEYFEKKKDVLSIVSPVGQNAVQIMTIHKSKGLEFPVVIFPYADLDIYAERDPKAWYRLKPESYNNFPHTILNYNKDIENYGDDGFTIYNTHQSQLELDNINLLYVALTRPIEQLFIISKNDVSAKGDVNLKKYSGLFISYLQDIGLWADSQLIYEFGNPTTKYVKEVGINKPVLAQEFISTPKESHNIKIVTKSAYLWDSNQQQAIEKGNLIHNLMSHIKTKEDVDIVINDFLSHSIINTTQASILKQVVINIVSHEELGDYFKKGFQIYNERDLISVHGTILRPDRVVINSKNEAVLIDYKTGKEQKSHYNQLQSYQAILEDMELKITKKILVYIDDNISVKIC